MTDVFREDGLQSALRRLIRAGGLLEPHQHLGLHFSLSEMMALSELVDEGAMSQQRLAELLGLEKSTVSRLAAGLERRGWIARERSPANRRIYQLELTTEGRRIADLIGADLRDRHQMLLAQLTPAEREGLMIGLAGLARVVHDQHGGGAQNSRPGAEAEP